MPLIDVGELMYDPDFVEDFVVIRSQRAVNRGGLTVDTPAPYIAFGSIQPASGAQLQILPEAERMTSTISVTTTFRLTALTPQTAADQVIWRGNAYRVITVNDWKQWGAQGFVTAVCQLTGMVQDAWFLGPPTT